MEKIKQIAKIGNQTLIQASWDDAYVLLLDEDVHFDCCIVDATRATNMEWIEDVSDLMRGSSTLIVWAEPTDIYWLQPEIERTGFKVLNIFADCYAPRSSIWKGGRWRPCWRAGIISSRGWGTFQRREGIPRDWWTRQPSKEGELPLDVAAKLLHWWCPGDGQVLNVFMGNGSVLVVAEMLGLEAYGVEYDKKLYSEAVRRMRAQTSQMQLF